MTGQQHHFDGFDSPNYTQVPDQLFDELMADLSGAELKVLLYVMRRTFGFKKGSDRISKSQLENGIQKRNGDALDRGTGLSRRAIRLAIDALVERRVLLKKTWNSDQKGHETTEYALNVRGRDPWVKSTQGGGVLSTQGLGYKVPTQETVIQQTDTNDVERSNVGNASNSGESTPTPNRTFRNIGDALSPTAQRAYETYKRIRAARPDAPPPAKPTARKRNAAEGLSDEQVGFARVLEEDMVAVLGSPKQNSGFYRVLALDAFRQSYEDLIRECLSLTRAGDVPRGTIGNRSGYFTKILRAKASERHLNLPIKPPRR